MKAYIKAFLFRGFCGSIIGLAIGHTVYLIAALQGTIITVEPKDVIINYIATLLVGFWCCSISVVFSIDEWSLLRQTVTHAILLLPYLPFAFYIGWAPPGIIGKVIFVIFYVVVYGIIWMSFKNYWTKRAKELNEGLKQINLN